MNYKEGEGSSSVHPHPSPVSVISQSLFQFRYRADGPVPWKTVTDTVSPDQQVGTRGLVDPRVFLGHGSHERGLEGTKDLTDDENVVRYVLLPSWWEVDFFMKPHLER